MGRSKKVWEELIQSETVRLTQPFSPPVIHVMLCDGVPLSVYVDKQTAEYEAHLCGQADEQMDEAHTYIIKTMPLVTHRLDF